MRPGSSACHWSTPAPATTVTDDGIRNVDLTTLGNSVDWAILEDYSGALGETVSGCSSGTRADIDCSANFAGGLTAMCDLPPANVSIGLIATSDGGTNGFAGAALDALDIYGYQAVAVWPDDLPFLDTDGISPAGSNWYSLLADFLARQ